MRRHLCCARKTCQTLQSSQHLDINIFNYCTKMAVRHRCQCTREFTCRGFITLAANVFHFVFVCYPRASYVVQIRYRFTSDCFCVSQRV